MKQSFMIMAMVLHVQGGNNMKLFKLLAGTLAVGAGACAVMGKMKRDKEKQEELDEFLCPDIDEPVVQNIEEETKEEPVEDTETQEEE